MSRASFHTLRFNRAAARYENEAQVQLRMAERLLKHWDGTQPAKILEFGCGTGLLTRKLQARFVRATLLATDAAPRMLQEAASRLSETAPSRITFLSQDAEGAADPVPMVLQGAPYDIIASNALVQWFPDLEKHLRFVSRLSRSGTAYLLSGFNRDNFPELNALLMEPPFSYSRFPGHDPQSLRFAAAATGWEIPLLHAWEEKEAFPSAKDALRRIQSLGSSRDPRHGGRLTRGNLDRLLAEYQRRFAEAEGVRLTWRPWIAWLRKR